MFRSIENMSKEEIKKELDAIKLFRKVREDISVDSLLDEKIDTSFLKQLNCSLTPNKQLFNNEMQGFLGEILEKMFVERQMYKKKAKEAEKQAAVESDPIKRKQLEDLAKKYDSYQQVKKVCLNSSYGALGNEFFRFFDVRQAEGITTSGQLAILWIIKQVNQFFNKMLKTENKDYVIAADTDSCYISMDALVTSVFDDKEQDPKKVIGFLLKACDSQLKPFINNACQQLSDYTNAYVNRLDMKHEKICDVGIITGKKRYIWNVWYDEGITHKEPKIKYVGLEMVRSSVPEICRNKLKETTKIILSQTENDLQSFIKKFKKEYETMRPEDISFPRGMNGLLDYTDRDTIYKKGTPIHVRGSLLFNHYVKKKGLDKKYDLIKEGSKIKFCYLKLPNPIKENVIAYIDSIPKELNLQDHIDYATMFDKSFLEPLKVILNLVGWQVERKKSLF